MMKIVRQILAERKYSQNDTKANGRMNEYSNKELLRMVKSVNLEGLETAAFFKEKFNANQFPSRGDLSLNLGIGFRL